MQVFHETVPLTDSPLPPEESTPSQRLFRAYLMGEKRDWRGNTSRMPDPVLAANGRRNTPKSHGKYQRSSN